MALKTDTVITVNSKHTWSLGLTAVLQTRNSRSSSVKGSTVESGGRRGTVQRMSLEMYQAMQFCTMQHISAQVGRRWWVLLSDLNFFKHLNR